MLSTRSVDLGTALFWPCFMMIFASTYSQIYSLNEMPDASIDKYALTFL
jgi:hypothetical protein